MNIGEKAPDFVLDSTEGGKFSLDEARSRGPVIVAFFPLAFTPG